MESREAETGHAKDMRVGVTCRVTSRQRIKTGEERAKMRCAHRHQNTNQTEQISVTTNVLFLKHRPDGAPT